ncbi:response regulator [Haematomicrobium sanguinis]|uniref:response regulator n=1 Tax=Haematomicrobium sanguinis TaxID=479106 RepID=UPI000478A1E9|nr:response regulator [Haematomicrobium sanguinis]
MTTVLIVDDDTAIRQALHINLKVHGYATVLAADGESALEMAAQKAPDIVLLDLGLPGLSGMDVIPRLRAFSDVPIVVLSARQGSEDKVEALDAGADDYVTKPFGLDELLARLRAHSRRRTQVREDPEVETSDFTVDLLNQQVTRKGEQVKLTPTEWKLMENLAKFPGRLVTQQELLHNVWGPAYAKETQYLRVYMNQLRRKLEPDPANPRHIITEAGMGYRLMP